MSTITNEPQRPALKPLQPQLLQAQAQQPLQPIADSVAVASVVADPAVSVPVPALASSAASSSSESDSRNKWWRGWRRRVVTRAMGLVLAYQLILVSLAWTARTILLDVMAVSRDEFGQWEGVLSLIMVAIAIGFLTVMRRRDILTREFWMGGSHTDTYGEPNQIGRTSQYGGARMTPGRILTFVVLTFGVQALLLLTSLILVLAGTRLVSPSLEDIQQSLVTVSMWVYAGLVGPICEEMLFRGVLLKELKPLGRNFAIVTSALAFGLFHQDFTQGAFSFVLGLLLGFVAMEYSLVWAIALHIFNNVVFGEMNRVLMTSFGYIGPVVYVLSVLVIGVIGTIIVLVRHGGGLKRYCRDNRSTPGTYLSWTSWTFLAFAAITLAFAAYYFAGALMG